MNYQEERSSDCRISDAWTYKGLKTVILENNLIQVIVLADKGADIYSFIDKETDTDVDTSVLLLRYQIHTDGFIAFWSNTI